MWLRPAPIGCGGCPAPTNSGGRLLNSFRCVCVWLCGCVAVWLCGCVALCGYGCGWPVMVSCHAVLMRYGVVPQREVTDAGNAIARADAAIRGKARTEAIAKLELHMRTAQDLERQNQAEGGASGEVSTTDGPAKALEHLQHVRAVGCVSVCLRVCVCVPVCLRVCVPVAVAVAVSVSLQLYGSYAGS